MSHKLLIIVSSTLIFITIPSIAEDFNPKVGNSWTYMIDGQPFTTKIYTYNKKVNGYSVLLQKSPQDPYGGGTYIGHVPGVGLCDIGADVHDAITEDYEGIAINYPPIPINGGLCYGDAVGTIKEWTGYSKINENDSVEFFDKDVWEILGYEDVTVPFGTFVNAMKVLCKDYYSSAYEEGGIPISENDWEFVPSCSEYIWWVPCVGMIKSVDYEEFDTFELSNCKVSCPIVLDPTPAELSLTLTGKNLPSSVLCDSSTPISLIVEIKNVDTKACHLGTTVNISFYMQNIDTQEKMQIGELLDRSISNLAPGKIKKFMARLTLPNTLDIGNYYCVAEMGDNVTILSDHVLSVEQPFVSLQMEPYASNLPETVVVGTNVNATIKLNIFNQGNIPTSRTETATIEVMARPIGGGSDKSLAVIESLVRNLAPTKSKRVTVPITFGADIPEGDYAVVICLDGNELEIDSAVKIAEPFVSLQMELLKSNIPLSIVEGTNVKAYILLDIFNRGNILTSKTETATIEVMARPIGGGSDISLAINEYPIKNLAPSRSKKVNLPITFGADIPEGDYTVVVCLDGNELEIDSAVKVSPPFIKLEMELIRSNIPPNVIAGTPVNAVIQLDIFNQGNIPTSITETATIEVMARPIGGGSDVSLAIEEYPVKNLAPSRSKKVNLPITFSADIPEGDYNVVICLGETEFVIEPPLKIAEPFVSVQMELVKSNLPQVVVAGTDVNTDIQLNIFNRGNITTAKTETATIEVFARPVGGGSDISLMMNEYPIGSLAPSKSKQVKFPVGFPAYIPDGTYTIGINLDAEEQILIDSPIEIAEPSIDITGSLTGSIPSKIIVIGNSTHVAFSLVITNNGTTLTSKSQTIGIAVYGRQLQSDPYILLGQISGCNVGNIANGQGLKGNFTVPIEISDGFMGGKYDLVAFVDSQNVILEGNEDDNWISLGQADIEVINSFMDITMFNGGHSMDYKTNVKGDYYRDNGPGIASVYYGSNGDVSESYDFESGGWGRQEYEWRQQADGVHLTEYYWPPAGGYENYQFEFDTLVMPKDFQLNKKYTNASTGSGRHYVYGASLYINGTAETSCGIMGIENVTVNGIKYDAFKVEFSLVIDADGILDQRSLGGNYYDVNSLLKQDVTYWTVPGTGVVKSTINYYYKLTLSGKGGGYEIWKGSEKRELIP